MHNRGASVGSSSFNGNNSGIFKPNPYLGSTYENGRLDPNHQLLKP